MSSFLMGQRKILTIHNDRNHVLRTPSKTVQKFGVDLKHIVSDMLFFMNAHHGVGLAAPQVGVAKKLFITKRSDGGCNVYVNPTLLFTTSKIISIEEGCLSIPNFFRKVERISDIKIVYQCINGAWHEDKLTGFDSIVAQHEFDHLSGKLIDRQPQHITETTKP